MHVNICSGGDPADYNDQLEYVVKEIILGDGDIETPPELEQNINIMIGVVNTLIWELPLGVSILAMDENDWSGEHPVIADTHPCTHGFDFNPVNLNPWTIFLGCQYFVHEWFDHDVSKEMDPCEVLTKVIIRMYGDNHLNQHVTHPLRHDMNLWYHVIEYVMGSAYDCDLDRMYRQAQMVNVLHTLGFDMEDDDNDGGNGNGGSGSGDEGSCGQSFIIFLWTAADFSQRLPPLFKNA